MSRPETGSMQFGQDWPGVFIRGDNAGYYAFLLTKACDRMEKAQTLGAIDLEMLRQLTKLLSGSNAFTGDMPQLLKPFDDCMEVPPDEKT